MISAKELQVHDYQQVQEFLSKQKERMTETEKELLEKGLPKWPQLVITGESVDEEQALEVIIRTDQFFNIIGETGNNVWFEKQVCKVLNLYHAKDVFEEKDFEKRDIMRAHNKEICEKLGIIRLAFVKNNYISCCFVGGPHGFMNPDGKIFYNDNIGKYPSVEEVYVDLCVIASHFPFLKMEATIMSDESCIEDRNPVVSFIVENGEVFIIDPKKTDVHLERRGKSLLYWSSFQQSEEDIQARIHRILKREVLEDGRTDENAIPLESIKKYAERKIADFFQDFNG